MVLLLMSGITTTVSVKAGLVRDSASTHPLDTISSYDIFEKLSESSSGQVILGGDDIRAVFNELKTQKYKPLKGWRIRIFRDRGQSALRNAESVKSDIEKAYTGIPVYVTHNSPNFFVDVGDYRTQDDAEKMRRKLISSYTGASMVLVAINFPPL